MNKILVSLLLLLPVSLVAQRIEKVDFGDFDQWRVREIKESGILGGHTKYIYAIAPNDSIKGAIAYKRGRSPWASSNVLAVVSGITKTSNTVYPEKRGNGRCARLETSLVNCKVLGIVNITVLASGSIYLGETLEPIHSTSNPYSKLDMGIVFTKRPVALVYDYKAKIAEDNVLTKATGISVSTLSGKDYAEVFVLLQKRWEDSEGNILAKRVGTGKEYIGKSTDWVNGHRLEIMYGNITSTPAYKPYMGLTQTYYGRNSQGEMMPVKEVGWADKNETPTHMIVMLSSGSKGAYTGALGNSLTVDNVGLVY